jgi:hypothetical protein
VSFYAPGATSPSRVVGGVLQSLYWGTYDSAGNLYVTGIDSQNGGHIVEIAKGASTISDLGTVSYLPSGIQVSTDGRLHVLDRTSNQALNTYSHKGGKLKFIKSMPLTGVTDAEELAFLPGGRRIFVADNYFDGSKISGTAREFKFPQGGAPTRSISVGGITDGVAVMPAYLP